MRIKGFQDFTDNLNESTYGWERGLSAQRGKTKFSQWLRSISQKLDSQVTDTSRTNSFMDAGPGVVDRFAQSRKASQLIPGLFRLITGAGAAIADFFTPSKSGQKLSKSDIKNSKGNILDDWEKNEIGDKKVNDSDAEKFYTSGVLKGKKYFGPDFDPSSPKNRNERDFSDYLNSAMHRYYDRIHTTNK